MTIVGSTDTPFGSLIDVPGIGVGHHQRTSGKWQTGTTVVACPAGATPGVDVRGGGPGTRETDALRPENLVREIHAVCLTGGSAYGLAAADGVMKVLAAKGLGFPIADGVVPVVPAAVIFDLGRSGAFDARPDPSFGERACRRALSGRGRPDWGSVGAGTGARAGGLQGGVGTASTRVRIEADPDGEYGPPIAEAIELTIGAIAVVNASGSPVDLTTGLPWETGGRRTRRPNKDERAALRESMTVKAGGNLNTTIGVVAVSAALDKAEASKLASVAHDGLARAIRPAHAMTDGDTIFSLATGDTVLPDGPARLAVLDRLLTAGAEVFGAACTHAVVAATTIGASPAWSDLCPSGRVD